MEESQKVGSLSVKMLDMLEEQFQELNDNGIDTEIGIVHIAVEIYCKGDKDEWTECFVQSNERRGWVKNAFLRKLADAGESMTVEINLEDEEDE